MLTFFDIVKFQVDFELVPFDVAPVIFTIQYVRPEAIVFDGTPFDLQVNFAHSLTLVDVSVSTGKYVRMMANSLVDFAVDAISGTNSWTPFPADIEDYPFSGSQSAEPYGFDIETIFVDWLGFASTSFDSWYGEGVYYKIWLWGTRSD